MRVLVTGGAGFVGTNLVKRLLKDNHQVVSFDNYSTGSKDNRLDGCTYIDIDITESFTDWVEKFDVIFHLAALPRIKPSFENPKEVCDVNVVGTQNVAPTYNGQYQFIATDANGCEAIPVFFEVSFPLSVDDFHENRQVEKITDLLGREVNVVEVVDKTTLLYIYSDRTVEKKIVIE